MLNEYTEFYEYTCPIDQSSPKRLKRNNVVSYKGVPRALKIISRYAYYHTELKGLPEKISYLLNLWCGFEDNNEKYGINRIPEFDNIVGWLPRYMEGLLDKDKREAILKDLSENRKELWNREAFQESGTVNDKNSIYFDSIIADAINQGRLRKRFLAFEKDPAEGFAKKGKCLYDRNLKLIAAILLNKIPSSDWARVNYAEYSNWVKLGCDCYNKVKDRVIPELCYKMKKEDEKVEADLPIISYDYLLRTEKLDPILQINEKWIEIYRPQIIEEENLGNIGNNLFVFEDKGCMYPLSRIE